MPYRAVYVRGNEAKKKTAHLYHTLRYTVTSCNVESRPLVLMPNRKHHTPSSKVIKVTIIPAQSFVYTRRLGKLNASSRNTVTRGRFVRSGRPVASGQSRFDRRIVDESLSIEFGVHRRLNQSNQARRRGQRRPIEAEARGYAKMLLRSE